MRYLNVNVQSIRSIVLLKPYNRSSLIYNFKSLRASRIRGGAIVSPKSKLGMCLRLDVRLH